MKGKPKRPRPARYRTLPSDEKSLERQARSLHGEVVEVVRHLKRHEHDFKSRARLKILHNQRAKSFRELQERNSARAQTLIRELDGQWSKGGNNEHTD